MIGIVAVAAAVLMAGGVGRRGRPDDPRIARGGGAAFELHGEAEWRGGRDEAGEPVIHVGSFRGGANVRFDDVHRKKP